MERLLAVLLFASTFSFACSKVNVSDPSVNYKLINSQINSQPYPNKQSHKVNVDDRRFVSDQNCRPDKYPNNQSYRISKNDYRFVGDQKYLDEQLHNANKYKKKNILVGDSQKERRDQYLDVQPYNINKDKYIVVGDNKTIKLDKYLNLKELENLIFKLALSHPGIVRPTVLTERSAFYRTNIYAVQISRDVREPRKFLKPMFKFVANVHGTDAVGYSLMTSLMQYLVYSDGYNPRVTRLLNNTAIWIIPTVNPDGFSISGEGCEDPEEAGETNFKQVDLDNDFPYPARPSFTYPASAPKIHIQQPESKNIMDMIKHMSFVLSGNLQGGAIVASCPYDSAKISKGITPDDEIFKKLAKGYAEKNPMMSPGNACNRTFPGGIVNKMKWNKKSASMQDANYRLSNCFEITLYLSCCKYPPAADLPMYWHANLDSMLSFMESTRQGIFGKIVDNFGDPVKKALVKVAGNGHVIRGTARGEYWRLLLPGLYTVTARAPAALDQTREVNVTETDPYVQLDFTLQRQGVHGQVTYKRRDFPNSQFTLPSFRPPKKEELPKAIIRIEKINDYIYSVVSLDKHENNETVKESREKYDKTRQGVINKDIGSIVKTKNSRVKDATNENKGTVIYSNQKSRKDNDPKLMFKQDEINENKLTVKDSHKKNGTNKDEKIKNDGKNRVEEINKMNGTVSMGGENILKVLELQAAIDEEFFQYLPVDSYLVKVSLGGKEWTKSINVTVNEPYVRVDFHLTNAVGRADLELIRD